MTATLTCPSCKAELPADAPQGVCPACLLRVGLETEPAVVELTPEECRRQELEEVLHERLPEYRFVKLLGRGGMGEVWLAEHQAIGWQVAIKVMSPAVENNPTFAERFEREARAMARLDHPNIVKIRDFGCAGKRYFIVMEYLPVNLREKGMGVGIERSLSLFSELCFAVEAVHRQGMVHRDLKPENILLTAEGNIKLADFGLALLEEGAARGGVVESSDSTNSRLRVTHGGLGTPLYMAPEQHDRPHEVDQRADVYALGLILHELVTGELPTVLSKTDDEELDLIVNRAQFPYQARYRTVQELRGAVKTVADRISKERIAEAEEAAVVSNPFGRAMSILGLMLWPFVWLAGIVFLEHVVSSPSCSWFTQLGFLWWYLFSASSAS
jgi:serine/threonine protein kinase